MTDTASRFAAFVFASLLVTVMLQAIVTVPPATAAIVPALPALA